MFDSSKELLHKIRLGEDSFLELKEVRFSGERVSAPHRDSLADELAAFANARGGVCVLGVDDRTREVKGIPLEMLDRVEDFVRDVCNDSVEPPLLPVIERLTLPTSTAQEAAVLKIEVQGAFSCTGAPEDISTGWGAASGRCRRSIWHGCSSSAARRG